MRQLVPGRPGSRRRASGAVTPAIPPFIGDGGAGGAGPTSWSLRESFRPTSGSILGRAAIAIDATHTKLDIGQLYLDALKRANGVVDGSNTIHGSNDEPGE